MEMTDIFFAVADRSEVESTMGRHPLGQHLHTCRKNGGFMPSLF
jgi:hypothetical protein